MSAEKKTGIFYVKDPAGVVVMWEGQEVYRYRNVEQFVAAHIHAVKAIESVKGEKIEKLIEGQYRPWDAL
ncbi:MAG: hypothetical protein HUJ31_09775 [Pseudomonadales bacterium]|nr:hypothetical protein [Pseudomonadales bacterium]